MELLKYSWQKQTQGVDLWTPQHYIFAAILSIYYNIVEIGSSKQYDKLTSFGQDSTFQLPRSQCDFLDLKKECI